MLLRVAKPGAAGTVCAVGAASAVGASVHRAAADSTIGCTAITYTCLTTSVPHSCSFMNSFIHTSLSMNYLLAPSHSY